MEVVLEVPAFLWTHEEPDAKDAKANRKTWLQHPQKAQTPRGPPRGEVTQTKGNWGRRQQTGNKKEKNEGREHRAKNVKKGKVGSDRWKRGCLTGQMPHLLGFAAGR